MADTVAQLTAERARLHGKRLVARVRADTLTLEVRDARLPGQNQAKTAHNYTPGSWHSYSVATSQSTFT